jgi:hypothetical protein
MRFHYLVCLICVCFGIHFNALSQESSPKLSQIIDVAPAWSGHSVGYCLLTQDNYQYVAYYDHNRQMTVAMRTLDSTEWSFKQLPEHVNWDSHHYITMSMDRDGYLHVSGNIHSDPLVYFRTSTPHDITTLRREKKMTGKNEKKSTYPQFIKNTEGDLLFLYRDGKSGDGVQLVNQYTTETQSWKRLLPTPLFDGLGKVSCYPEGPVLGPDGYFHLIWVWRVHGGCETNHNLCYARSKDMIHWETASGESIPLPMTPEHTKTIIDPVPVEGGMINESTVVGFDTQGRVILSYHKFDENGHTQIYNARFEKDRWYIVQTSDWKHRWYFSGGGTIEVDVDLGPVTVSRDGRLRQGYRHVKHGTGLWELDEKTLKAILSQPAGAGILGDHNHISTPYPDLKVRWKEDENQAPGQQHRYFLRWEAPLVTRDQERDNVAQPAMLKVYKIDSSEHFDPRMSCIHDGYF